MQESFGKRIWQLTYPLLTYIGVGYIVSFFFSFYSYMYAIINYGFPNFSDVTKFTEQFAGIYDNLFNEINMVTFIITIPLLIMYMYWDKKSLKALNIERPKNKRAAWYKYIILPVMGVSVCIAGTFMIVLGRWKLIGMNNLSEAYFTGKFVLELITLGFLYPITDELLFRGLLYGRLRMRTGKYMAAFVAALVYSFYGQSLSQGIYAFFMALLLTYVYERFGTIIAPILFSIAANIITVLEMEKKVLNVFYDNYGRFIGVTIGMAMIIIVCVLFIEKFVRNYEVQTLDIEISGEQKDE